MKSTQTVLFGILICCVLVSARHHGKRPSDEIEQDDHSLEIDDTAQKKRSDASNPARHRRKRWQMNYGYNYPPPDQSFYEHNRRNYDNNNQEYLPQIYKLLEEISAYVKRPAAVLPPQPIYIPYPIHVPVPQLCACNSNKKPEAPSISSRWPLMNDSNQNWGFEDRERSPAADVDYEDDNTGPISFDPIQPEHPLSRKQPDVEHGSSQAASKEVTTRVPFSSVQQGRTVPRMPSVCDAAVLSCCKPTDSKKEQLRCFSNLRCQQRFAGGAVCNPKSISSILESFYKAYSPKN